MAQFLMYYLSNLIMRSLMKHTPSGSFNLAYMEMFL